MSNIFFTSDTHFSHANLLTFKDGEGMHVRGGFKDADEMDEIMIERWNARVKSGDKVWHLGDVAFGPKGTVDRILPRLKGQKRLCLGNHDDLKGQNLIGHFGKIQLWRMFTEHGFVCTHIPLPPDQFRYKVKMNVHGHIHEKPDPSEQHMNICVEKTGYAPVHLDEIVSEIKRRNI